MAGRPRQFDRDDALRKARDAFWSRGYEGTSMSNLVDALGLASARIYAAFGSKDRLFQEAVELYQAEEGAFVTAALDGKAGVRAAIARLLQDGVRLYTRPGRPRGCMVVSSAANVAAGNEPVSQWLAENRRRRTARIVERLRRAVDDGEIRADVDVQAFGDCFAGVLSGLSVQARDGASRHRLLASIEPALLMLDAVRVAPDPARARRR